MTDYLLEFEWFGCRQKSWFWIDYILIGLKLDFMYMWLSRCLTLINQVEWKCYEIFNKPRSFDAKKIKLSTFSAAISWLAFIANRRKNNQGFFFFAPMKSFWCHSDIWFSWMKNAFCCSKRIYFPGQRMFCLLASLSDETSAWIHFNFPLAVKMCSQNFLSLILPWIQSE